MTPIRLCVLVNQYPTVSHSFIRREILALADRGVAIERVSMRGWDKPLVDPADFAEREKTTYLLKDGLGKLAVAALRELARRPARFLRALLLALRMSRASDKSVFHHLVYFAEACALATIVRARHIDHVHAHFGTNSTDVALLASVLTGIGYSFTVHGADEIDKPIALNLPEKVKLARFAVAVSNNGRGQLYRWCDNDHWSKIHVVHCGVDDAFLADTAQPVAAGTALVCVGRLCKEKAQLLLIDAAAILAREGHDFSIVLAGDGDMRPQVEAKIAHHGLADRVTITGWIPSSRVKDEMTKARALVLPSLMEGIPVVLMESMALQRPVVTTYVGGIPELVRDAQDGWLVPAGSTEDLAAALRACLTATPEVLAAMGRSGRSRVAEQHSVVTEAGKLAALIETSVRGTEPTTDRARA
jgi:colanic acid/amylovoran biosynthesis glycosyltransferase